MKSAHLDSFPILSEPQHVRHAHKEHLVLSWDQQFVSRAGSVTLVILWTQHPVQCVTQDPTMTNSNKKSARCVQLGSLLLDQEVWHVWIVCQVLSLTKLGQVRAHHVRQRTIRIL